MSDEQFDLKDLPRQNASADFEAMLFGDALAQIPSAEIAPISRRAAPIWLAAGMVASLAVGLWIGMGEMAILQDALSGLGVTPAELASEASEWNAYGDILSQMSS